MTTRAQLQSKSIDELREIAQAAELQTDGLQKSKLITALMDAGQVVDDAPAEVVDLPKATPRTERPAADKSPAATAPRDGGGQHQRDSQGQGGQRDGQGGQGQRRRNRRRRDEEQIPEADLEMREGLLDILPEGYGFLRVTGYDAASWQCPYRR